MKLLFKIVGVMFALLVVITLAAMPFVNRGMGEIRKASVGEVNLQNVADGSYNGSFCKGRWCYEVKVTVAGHRMSDIAITNHQMDGSKAANQAMIEKVKQEQKLTNDAVSGASINTRAFMKAVENALSAK
jgi:uncharacterized protein with FMN-binding domain